jgi:hypothetical protein
MLFIETEIMKECQDDEASGEEGGISNSIHDTVNSERA